MSIYCHKQGYVYVYTYIYKCIHTYMSVVVISWCITNSFIYFICLILLNNWRKEYLFLKCSPKNGISYSVRAINKHMLLRES